MMRQNTWDWYVADASGLQLSCRPGIDEVTVGGVLSDIWSVTLLVNWETGYTGEVRNSLVVDQRKDSSVIKSAL